MDVRIVGVDPGTANTGYSLLSGNTAPRTGYAHLTDYGVWRTKKDEAWDVRDRIDYISNQLQAFITATKATHLAIEDFTEQGKLVGKTYKEMSWIVENFRGVGRTLGLPTAVYANAEWKKILLRARQANKHQVMHYVGINVLGAAQHLVGQPDHVWDSAAVGYCMFKQLKAGLRIL